MLDAGSGCRIATDSVHVEEDEAAESNYPVHHKEMLSIVCALKEWRHYLHGAQFTVRILTDHRSLVHFNTQPKLSERQARWNEFIAEFGNGISIEYQEGKHNVVADALSRRPDHAPVDVNNNDTDTAGNAVTVNTDAVSVADDSVDSIGELLSMITVAESDIAKRIKRAYKDDDLCKQIIDGDVSVLKKNKTSSRTAAHRFTVSKVGVIMYDGNRVYVPDNKALKTLVIGEHHDSKLAGHTGYQKTYNLLMRNFYWPNMYRDTKLYVRSCYTCQRTKVENRKPAGLLQPLAVHHVVGTRLQWTL